MGLLLELLYKFTLRPLIYIGIFANDEEHLCMDDDDDDDYGAVVVVVLRGTRMTARW